MTGQDPRPEYLAVLDWAETTNQRTAALVDRRAAGEDVDAEFCEMFHDVLAKLACLLDTDRVKALRDRIEAGEQVDDAEFQATLLDAIQNMDGAAS
ncbi:MAG: hypothetical protein M3459_01525 [Actinomycetota bacterium]|nr:hypothetical protein [Actinomycetota bacterium]